jgi:hypothetical protein
MDIHGKRLLILGAFGQCGAAIVKLVLRNFRPSQIVLCSMLESEARSVAQEARGWADCFQPGAQIELTPEWGNMLLTDNLTRLRAQLGGDPAIEAQYADEMVSFIYREYNEFTPAEKQTMFLYRLLTHYRPHILVDCVNTATGLAYQDIFSLGKTYLRHKREGEDGVRNNVPFAERLLMSDALPGLVRHIEILRDGMTAGGTQLYLKVGTTGTGGMGLNIPYTHSESKPSRTLMSKSAVGGASSLLYLLMNRTAGGPLVKEIKPAALIGWKNIGYGEIKKHGQAIPLYDCPLDKGKALASPEEDFSAAPATAIGGNLQDVFIDTGENGVFSTAEFEAITSLEQMELVTPEDVARAAMEEIIGESTGFDIVASLNSVCLDSSYRGGVMRGNALEQLLHLEAAHGTESVAFEILGPPRLSKLLWEAYLIKQHGRLGALLAPVFDGAIAALEQRLALFEESFDAQALCEQIVSALANDEATRARIISIGIPICTPDLRLVYGPSVALMRAYPDRTMNSIMRDAAQRAYFLEHGAVVLMPGNLERWRTRIADAIRYHYLAHAGGHAGSGCDYRRLFSVTRDAETGRVKHVELHIGELIGLLFVTEEKGSRRRHFFGPDMETCGATGEAAGSR